MTRLCDICDPELLADAVDNGFVKVRSDGPLRIFNYTPKAAHGRVWNEATLACRGLIVDDSDRVVARPFAKFFGPSEPDAAPIPHTAAMEATVKLDGSLGIAYTHPDGETRVATRGSLDSPQAREATQLWREKYRNVGIPSGTTPLFEIVYPGNRIVVDYGDTRDLVLLAVIDNTTGVDIDTGTFDWPGPRAETVRFDNFVQLLDHVMSDSEQGAEGYVVRFAGGDGRPDLRIKLKFPAYVAAHRAVFGLTAARVWEAAAVAAAAAAGATHKTMTARLHLSPETVSGLLANGDDPVSWMRGNLPEEFHAWYDAAVDEIVAAAACRVGLYEQLSAQAATAAVDSSDRAFAAAAQHLAAEHSLHPGPLFALRNGRADARLAIWTQIRPTGHSSRASAADRTAAGV